MGSCHFGILFSGFWLKEQQLHLTQGQFMLGQMLMTHSWCKHDPKADVE